MFVRPLAKPHPDGLVEEMEQAKEMDGESPWMDTSGDQHGFKHLYGVLQQEGQGCVMPKCSSWAFIFVEVISELNIVLGDSDSPTHT